MRRESQTEVIRKLHLLIQAVEQLPEGAEVVAADTGIGCPKIHMEDEPFRQMFAGQEVERYGSSCAFVFKEDIKYFAGDVTEDGEDGAYLMPAIEPVEEA